MTLRENIANGRDLIRALLGVASDYLPSRKRYAEDLGGDIVPIPTRYRRPGRAISALRGLWVRLRRWFEPPPGARSGRAEW